MARIAYLDHSYHRHTRSTDFLPEILVRNGHQVDRFWDDSWQGGKPIEWESVRSHDIVIMFQSFCAPPAQTFRQSHPNVVYIPMLDQFGFWEQGNRDCSKFWEPFQGSKVLNFSESLHHVARSHGLASHSARYYQPASNVTKASGLHGFFWLRRELQVPWRTIRKLIGDTKFDSFHLHMVPDPGSPDPIPPTAEETDQLGITTSTWFKNKSDLAPLLDRANVYFAPRAGEGIGQSFLEAMARGKCVVVPDQGTMNEYVLHGVNGLVYDLHAPKALDFSRAKELGAAARTSVVEGHSRWLQAETELLNFILTPSSDFYEAPNSHNDRPHPTKESRLKQNAKALERWLRKRRDMARGTFTGKR